MYEMGDRVRPLSPSIGSPPWAVAYEAHADRLVRLATVLVGRDDAHDLVADAVMRAVRSATWSAAEFPGGYLTRVLVNLAHDRRSQASRRTQRETTSARLRSATAAQGADADVVRALVVQEALASLSAGQLAVVQLHYWEDMTLAQVAAHLGLRQGTVARQLDRAKRRLRVSLAAEGPTS
jgi:RNA polymerase sigma-70 factor (ECF subfamily)